MFASPAYDELVNMRIETLYQPLNAEINIEDLALEYKDVHLAVYDDKLQMIGGIVAKVTEEQDEFMNKRKICLLRQVFVKTKFQRLGLGKKMLSCLEKMLIDKGYKEIRLYAHLDVIDFYTRLGYSKHGRPFKDYGIKQHIMKKKIQKKSLKLDKLEAVGSEYS